MRPLQRWEYAQLLFDLSGSGTPRVVFTHSTEREAVDESTLDLIRQLGDEGWEMVGAVAMGFGKGTSQVVYFKRLLSA